MSNVANTHRFTLHFAQALLVIVVCFPQASRAQGGFPAFQPEEESAPIATSQPAAQAKFPQSATPSAKFPTGEVENDSKPAPQTQKAVPNPFPGGGKFPTGDEDETEATPAQPAQEIKSARVTFPTEEPAPAQRLDLERLEQLLEQISLKPTLYQRRHDFLYRVDLVDQEMELFFSTYLTADNSQLRIRAWLDPLPATNIPSEPLLKLLARNIEMRTGMHFGYSAEAKRFLLEAVLENEAVTAERLQATLDSISREVADSWSLWTTAQWAPTVPPRVADKPELDSRSIPGDQFEMPLRR